jgi:hypothetical protein
MPSFIKGPIRIKNNSMTKLGIIGAFAIVIASLTVKFLVDTTEINDCSEFEPIPVLNKTEKLVALFFPFPFFVLIFLAAWI